MALKQKVEENIHILRLNFYIGLVLPAAACKKLCQGIQIHVISGP